MSIAEVVRAIESAKRVQRERERDRAARDYILADLIGRSVSRIYNSANNMPKISEVYPDLFDAEEETEKIQEKRDELSAARFKQFADSFNARFKTEKGGGNSE